MSVNTRIGRETRPAKWVTNFDRIVAADRAASVLDRHVPLGFPVSMRPERGPSAVEYYARKHRLGERGRYFLHSFEIRKGGNT